jgi:hypothetical protein
MATNDCYIALFLTMIIFSICFEFSAVDQNFENGLYFLVSLIYISVAKRKDSLAFLRGLRWESDNHLIRSPLFSRFIFFNRERNSFIMRRQITNLVNWLSWMGIYKFNLESILVYQ